MARRGVSQFSPVFAVIFSACCVSYACCSDDAVDVIVFHRVNTTENLTISFITLSDTSNEAIDNETIDVAPSERVNVSLPKGNRLNIWLVQVTLQDLENNMTFTGNLQCIITLIMPGTHENASVFMGSR
jgi:uncharacterized lipoprotein YbaY